jgi:uncharacterized protein with GYD domain
MATYITTMRYTQQGIAAVDQTVKRANAIKALAKKLGLKVVAIYWTLGAFDGVLITEAPDDQTITAAMLAIGRQGNVQTTTARAFTAQEMEQVLARMGG